MQLDDLKKNVASLNNPDIDFFLQQVENLNAKTDVEMVFSGTISNGKSTLINALLETDLLPMELGATTALITTIQKGEDAVVAEFEDGSTQNYPLLKSSIETITEIKNARTIKILSQKFPYHGIRFVDTPGIDDISQTREERTFNYVPLGDAVIFMVDASKGLTREEEAFFENKVVKANKDKIFVVINKIDTIAEEIIVEKLLTTTIANEYAVYQISALRYLVGILKNDDERIEKSGAQKLKKDLDAYLKGLNKSKVFKMRMQKSLENILRLSNIQIDTLVNGASKDKPEIELSLKKVHRKIERVNEEKNKLEQEINDAVNKIKACVQQSLNRLKIDINLCIKNVEHKEFMLDKFNKEVPLLCSKMVEDIRICSDNQLNDLSFNFEEINDLHLYLIRNIDDVIAQLVWLLTFVPRVGKVVTPFIPKIQEDVRRFVDMLGGIIIQNKVESRVDELVNLLEENFYQSIAEYKSNLLTDYEHDQLGAVRSELISLESLFKMNADKKENIELQVQYYQNNKDLLKICIDTLIMENNS